ncbi:hypothetical protein K9M59_02210 [Candidatus Gracilibacteria bacterium]|nr:hypothetical protein [Candidatus Gracilibacteria bacterium]MCF7819656.1 hypothetical protein [Candidatus Gracilibacteria bacterium]
MKHMFKKFIVFGFLLFATGMCFEAQAITYNPYTSEYWQNLVQRYSSSSNQYRPSLRRSFNWGPGYYRNRQRRVITRDSWEPETPSDPTTSYFPPVRNTTIYRSRQNTSLTGQTDHQLTVHVNSIRPNQDVSSITSQPIRVFQIGVSNNSRGVGTDFVEPVLLDTLTFQMFSNSGIASDPTNFSLVLEGVEGQEFEFEQNGEVTLRFQKARLAQGDSLSFNVALKVDDPSFTPHVPGSLRLRLFRTTAVTESSQQSVRTILTGSPISDYISFDPAPQTTGTPQFSGTPHQIFGKTLSASEEATVLALNFSAHYDDMYIREITLEDTLSNGGVDSFINKIEAINSSTGEVLDTARFTNGRAHFQFSRRFLIPRNSQRQIHFDVQTASRINTGNQSSQFRLQLDPADIEVWGIGSGSEIPLSNKNFSVQTDTFVVVQSGGGMRVSPASQPNGFAVSNNLNQVYRFQISNPSNQDVSLGRITLNITLSGLSYPGGRSADDFQIKQIYGGQEVSGTSFTPSLGSGNTVTFDTGTELLINRHSQVELALKLQLEDEPGDVDADSVAVQVLGDSSSMSGTLSEVRSNGANFIWSDHSGRPHTTQSKDWLSGYLVNGLPTNTVVVKRNP